MPFNKQYPSVEDLRTRAQQKIPRFAFEYLDGGCNEDVNLHRNTSDIRELTLEPRYIRPYTKSDLKKSLFGHTYDAPFGIAPVGLQGLMWPNSPKILAQAAKEHNIPFILSTVTTLDIEEACKITDGKAWFQLYNPAEEAIRNDIIDRAQQSGCEVLVLLCDVPTFGYRPRDYKNGLALPPKMSMANILQILSRPHWALQTLKHGIPTFETLRPYQPEGLNLRQLGAFMDKTFSGRLNAERIKPIRDRWKGKLVLKGVASVEDTKAAIELGFDGVIVSNHGGRQLDAGESSITALRKIVEQYSNKITIMQDSGMRSGPDIARCLSAGADFTFLGRAFMYSVAALGEKGGEHAIDMFKTQLRQNLEQLCCERIIDLRSHLTN